MSEEAVGLVFVSHSSLIAEGLIALARQMAPDAALAAAGGTDEGGIGTSFELVSAGIAAVDSGAGVVVLCDLGSAILTAETALDFLDDDVRGRVRIVDAPLVEGGVAAAVAAQTGASLDEVVAAARSAAGGDHAQHGADEATPAGGSDDPTASHAAASVTLRNKDGLHARPAAEFVKLASTFAAKVVVNGKDAKSLLGIMSLGLVKGAVVELQADGPDAEDAIGALASLIESGFGEV
ncbi:dihydroxyacetone kinase phosphoryl donor subunit DhaM [Plantibacter sp. VKM Ac-2876]|uniref:dihydroxyacetone kinase phosphoryl donor subunit DhaM n=1 Tax=Plantibacter sp. VKM Ac-2876 TaxID=2783826 RepID=UPI00188B1886|nr:dihydroxyacetone kinase phosphoryl donor subunit DhaM [Plantibacter sp. VKM Ac-2876]MBF4564845.1 PTS-dependent dihydroxyacetone kinase phosphotransferase subunit DhaM [Plantibacter sp. VKM Ac-2876]